MKLVNIVPLIDQRLLLDESINHGYVMFLHHMVQNNLGFYASQAEQLHKMGTYIILDNSVVELGEACTIEDLCTSAHYVQADEIILPDVFRDFKSTYKHIKEYRRVINKYIKEGWLKKNIKVMAVCHANNFVEFRRNFIKLSKLKEIDTIGIPKVLCEWCVSRLRLGQIYRNTDKEIHFLGLSDQSAFDEFALGYNYAPDYLKIRSVDTCQVAAATINQVPVNTPKNQMLTKFDLTTCLLNVDEYKKNIFEVKNNFAL